MLNIIPICILFYFLYFPVVVITHSVWDFSLDIAGLGWALLNCICIWPPVATLLPRVETAQGWRIQWQNIFHLATASSDTHTIGRTSLLGRKSTALTTGIASPRANRALSTPFETVEVGKALEDRQGTNTSDRDLHLYESGTMGWSQKSNDTTPSQRSIDRQRSANIGRIAGRLRTAASLQASALLTGTILPEREGYTSQASRQPSMLAIQPSGELGPAPSGSLSVFSLQKAPSPDSINKAMQKKFQWKDQASFGSAIDRQGSKSLASWEEPRRQNYPSMPDPKRMSPAPSGALKYPPLPDILPEASFSHDVQPAVRELERAGSRRVTLDRRPSTSIGRVSAPMLTQRSLQQSAFVTGDILPERDAFTSQASRAPSMLTVAPSGDLRPAPSGSVPGFALQTAASIDVSSATPSSPWARQAERAASMGNPGGGMIRPGRARSERRQPAWLAATIDEDYSLKGSRIQSVRSSAVDASHEGSNQPSDLVVAAAAKLTTIQENYYNALYDSGPSTPGKCVAPEEDSDQTQDSPTLAHNAAGQLAVLAALTGDPTTWAQVHRSTGQTYNGADAPTLLEEIGAMEDYDSDLIGPSGPQRASLDQNHIPTGGRSQRASFDLPSPFLVGQRPMPLVPASTSTGYTQIMRDNSVNGNSLVLDESLIIDDEMEAREMAYLQNRVMIPQATSAFMSSFKPSLNKATVVTVPYFRPFAAATQQDLDDLPIALAPSFETHLVIDAEFFKPFAAAAQDDCRSWMALDRSSTATSRSSMHKLSPTGRISGAKKLNRVSFDPSL